MLAHPSGNDWGKRRVKNDERDARDLADLLRLGRLAEAWIAPPSVREARELVRYARGWCSYAVGSQGAGAHGDGQGRCAARDGVDMFGPKGQTLLDAMELAGTFVGRVESLRDLIEDL